MLIKVEEETYKIVKPSLEMILDLNPENELETFLIPQLLLENIITKILELNNIDYVTIYEKKGERLQKKLNNCEFSSKIDHLKSISLINNDEHIILKEICDLRNCYVHNLIYEVKESQIMKLLNCGKNSKIFFNIKEINEFLEKYNVDKTYYNLIDLLYTIMISFCFHFNKYLEKYNQAYDFGYITDKKEY